MSKKDYKSISDIAKAISSNIKKDDTKYLTDWMVKNKIRTEDGDLISYEERRFLVDFMNDMSQKQAVMASAQLGKTVSVYLKAIYLCFQGHNVGLSEPTQDLRDTLVKSKLNRLIEGNQIFKDTINGDLNIKKVKDRMLFLTYTFGGASAIGFTADTIIIDEVSRSNPQTVDMLKSRILNSKFKNEWYISNPAMPNDTLHNTFLNSDQKHWAIKPSCGCKRQILNYDGMYGYSGNVDKDTGVFKCQYCGKELEPTDIINGEWVKRYQNRDISGYWMNQMMRPMSSKEELTKLGKELVYEEKKNKQAFYNLFLGLPYGGSDINISPTTIKRNLVDPRTVGNQPVVMGCDIGSATGHHYVIGRGKTVIKLGRAKDWNEIRSLIKEYSCQYIIVDNMPENGPAKELQSEYPNFVWRGNYVRNNTEKVIDFNEETGLVNIARNIHFDNIINGLNDGEYKFAFAENDRMLADFCEQFGTISKIAKFDSYGNPTFAWEAPEGAWDHFAHAFLYYTVAIERLEMMTPSFGIARADDGENVAQALFGRDSEDFFGSEKSEKSWLDL